MSDLIIPMVQLELFRELTSERWLKKWRRLRKVQSTLCTLARTTLLDVTCLSTSGSQSGISSSLRTTFASWIWLIKVSPVVTARKTPLPSAFLRMLALTCCSLNPSPSQWVFTDSVSALSPSSPTTQRSNSTWPRNSRWSSVPLSLRLPCMVLVLLKSFSPTLSCLHSGTEKSRWWPTESPSWEPSSSRTSRRSARITTGRTSPTKEACSLTL